MAGLAAQPHPATEVFDDLAADRQAQTGALRALAGLAALAEFLEDQLLLRERHAGSVVADLDRRAALVAAQRHDHLAAALRHELGGVAEQVEQHLQQTVVVGVQHRHNGGLLHPHPRAAFAIDLGSGLHRVRDQLAQVDRIVAPIGVAGLDLGHVENLVDQPRQPLGFGDHQIEKLLPLCTVHLRIVAHQLGEGADRGQGGAQFVGHRRHEVVLQPVQALELAVERPHLRGLVEQTEHVVWGERLLLDDRGHHGACRGAADRAGELRLDVLHQLRIGRDALDAAGAALLGVVGEQALRRRRAEEAARHLLQLGQAGTAAPEHRRRAAAGRRPPEHIDEQQRLSGLARRRCACQRHRHVQPGVGQQAPQQRVGQAVQAGQAEQLLGPQQRDAEQAFGHEGRRQPARLGDRRQHQRVGPQRKSGGQPGQRAGARAALPEHAAEQCGRELRHRGKADQADADQRIGLAGDAEVQIAQQQQHHDHDAPQRQRRAAEIACVVAAAKTQQQRHHEVVADHRRDRDRLDDDHPGGRRQPADEGCQCQQRPIERERQRQHEGFRIGAALAEVQQPAERDRQHEQVDQQQVQREGPTGAPDMPLVDVLDHHDLELAWQEDHRKHRQQRQCEPLPAGEAALAAQAEQRLQIDAQGGAREDLARAVEEAPADEHADRHEGQQLDHRLQRDGGHHALVPLAGVEVAGAEGDREAGQCQRDVQRAVVPPGPAGMRRAGAGSEQRVAAGDGLQLQCDVRQDADQRDHRHQRRQRPALAIAAGDEVGDRRDAVLARDADHLAQHRPSQQHRQRRPQVDRQEPQARRRGAADAAEVGPRRAVNTHRQGIDPGVADH